MAMGEEEHGQKCSNSSSDGSSRSSKKLKQKKIPQRGLGVAQLEKIRLEEQHRRDNNVFQAPHDLSPNSMVSSLTSPTILLPNISRPHFSSTSCVPKVDHPPLHHSNPTFPLSKQLNLGGGERGRSGPALMIPGNTYWPKLWNGEYNLEGENQRLDRHGIGFRPNVNLPIESHTSVLPLPNALQRSQQYQHPASSSMVNILSEISSSSSGRNFQKEPPSNQNYRANHYSPLWPEEVKMVGVKRPYPFSPEYPPLPSFHCKFPPAYVPSTSTPNEPTSYSNANPESRNLPIREGTSNSNAQFESKSRSLLNQENGNFLSLAPPTASKNPLPINQRGGEELIKRSGMNGSASEPHMFSFFPAAKVHIDLEDESPKRRYKSDSNGVVDLNLKL